MHSENVLFTFICSVFHFQHKAVSYGPTAVSSALYTQTSFWRPHLPGNMSVSMQRHHTLFRPLQTC